VSEPPVDVRRRENPVTQGLRYGATGCAGCITFAVIAFVLLLVLAALGAHH
jgi:hypothetical protein